MTNDLQLPGGLGAEDLDLDRYKIRLRLREPARFGFLHGAMLHRLTSRLAGAGPLGGLFSQALESGHVRYQDGDVYDFVLAAAGERRSGPDELAAALSEAGRKRPPGAQEGTLGLFDLESLVALRKPSLGQSAERAAALARQAHVSIRLTSPLRLRRQPELARPESPPARPNGWPPSCSAACGAATASCRACPPAPRPRCRRPPGSRPKARPGSTCRSTSATRTSPAAPRRPRCPASAAASSPKTCPGPGCCSWC